MSALLGSAIHIFLPVVNTGHCPTPGNHPGITGIASKTIWLNNNIEP